MGKGHLHVTSFVDPHLWDDANWLGVAYLLTPSGEDIPVMGLVFEREMPALDIFAGWVAKLGREDQFEQIRISVVEGSIPGKEAGYSVVVSSDIEGVLAYSDTRDLEFEPEKFAVLWRCKRMPAGKSAYDLQTFKDHYRRHHRFELIPVIYNSRGTVPYYENGIEKHRIYLRQSSDVSGTDVDACIYQSV
jgi:hypothetical protein